MTDSEEISDQRAGTREALYAEYAALARPITHWKFRMGPLRLGGPFGSIRLAQFFVGFHFVVAAVGAGLIFFGGSPRELGMAMVAGALFGFGAFLAQVWAVQMGMEHWLREWAAATKLREIDDRLQALDEEKHE